MMDQYWMIWTWNGRRDYTKSHAIQINYKHKKRVPEYILNLIIRPGTCDFSHEGAGPCSP